MESTTNRVYDYLEEMTIDIKNYILENRINFWELAEDEEAMQRLEEELWMEDSVTGNGCGSYWCNTWKAEEALCHNLHLVEEATEGWGFQLNDETRYNAERLDVLIRCYLLPEALRNAVERLMSETWFESEVPY